MLTASLCLHHRCQCLLVQGESHAHELLCLSSERSLIWLPGSSLSQDAVVEGQPLGGPVSRDSKRRHRTDRDDMTLLGVMCAEAARCGRQV
jgi:hypothetical protein